MNIRKKLLCMLLICSMFSGFVCAENQKLVLHHADGTETEVELLTRPKIQVQGSWFIVNSDIVNLTYEAKDILSFTYSGIDKTGIASMESDYRQEEGQLVFKGIKQTDKVSLYTIDGKQLPVAPTIVGSDAVLPLASIKKGTYLLKVNNRTTKFMKR